MRTPEPTLGKKFDLEIPVDINPVELYQSLLPPPGSDPGLGYAKIMDTGINEVIDAVLRRAQANITVYPDQDGRRFVVFTCYLEAQDPITDLMGNDLSLLEQMANSLRPDSYVPKDTFGLSVKEAGAGEFVINVHEPEGPERFLRYVLKVSDQYHMVVETQFYPWEELEQERLHDLLRNFAYICARTIEAYYAAKGITDLPHYTLAFSLIEENEKGD